MRRKDLLPTAELPADDDYFLLDGETEGIRKMLAGTFRDARNLRYNLGVTGSQERSLETKVGEGTLLSVKDFGAKGDFTTDDSDAIQAAIDAVQTDPRQWAGIYLLGGMYRTTKTLKITWSHFAVVGDGSGGALAKGYPFTYSGSMIIVDFERTKENPGLLHYQSPSGMWIYRAKIAKIRFGIFSTRTNRPDGLILDGVSEFEINNLYLNNGLRYGIAFNVATLGSIRNIATGGNTADFYFSTPRTDLSSSLNVVSGLWFSNINSWLGGDAFRFDGNVRDIYVIDSYTEFKECAFRFLPGAADRVYSEIRVTNFYFSNAAGGPYPAGKLLIAEAADNAIGLRVRHASFVNCRGTVFSDATEMIRYIKGTNTSGNSFLDRLTIIGGTFVGMTNALVHSDAVSSLCTVFGTVTSVDSSSVVVPLVDGSTQLLRMTTDFGFWDMRGGRPIALPTGAVHGFSVPGQLWFDASTNRVSFTDSTAQVFLPRPQIATYGDADGTISLASSGETHIWNEPLTSDRAITLPSSSLANGLRYRIVSTAAATDDFNINVGTAEAQVTLLAPAVVPPPNVPPIAMRDAVVTAKNTAISIDILGNDTDADGDTLRVAGLTVPLHGSVMLEADDLSPVKKGKARFFGGGLFWTRSGGFSANFPKICAVTENSGFSCNLPNGGGGLARVEGVGWFWGGWWESGGGCRMR